MKPGSSRHSLAPREHADINHPNRLGALRTTLLIAGGSPAHIDAFCADNWLAFMKHALSACRA